MCNSRICEYPCGQEEFKRCEETLTPGQVLFPTAAMPGSISYGVMVHQPAQQWEIVAVQGQLPRHVAFVSTALCLDRVLEIAARISAGH